MERNIFIQMSKLHNVMGRINYISSTARQENLYAVYETTPRPFWQKLAKENQRDFVNSGAAGKCIEARELIIALPENFVKYEPNELLRDYTEFFKRRYGVECISALHHNKRKANYHIHLIFSERRSRSEPIRKIAGRNMFYDEAGKKVRTKKEIMDSKGNIRKGCTILKKGEVYAEHLFEKKDPKFKQRDFLNEVKESYRDKMNEKLADHRYQMKVFQKGSPYLPMKKIGKNNPKTRFIVENNRQRLRWNKAVSNAAHYKVPMEILIAVKKNEVIKPIQLAIKDNGTATDMVLRIIDRAVSTLHRFVKAYLYGRLNEKPKANSDSFFKLLDSCRGTLKKTIESDRKAR